MELKTVILLGGLVFTFMAWLMADIYATKLKQAETPKEDNQEIVIHGDYVWIIDHMDGKGRSVRILKHVDDTEEHSKQWDQMMKLTAEADARKD